jgi:hypothetical protein
MFRLPICMPEFAHLSSLVFLDFLSLAEPFVLLLSFFPAAMPVSCARFGTFFLVYLPYYIIWQNFVALAHRGAIPLPTPAGLKLGGLLRVAAVEVVLRWWLEWSI